MGKKRKKLYIAKNKKNNEVIIKQDKKYFRAAEVEDLLGNSAKARKLLNWKPKKNLHALIREMISEEMKVLN